MRTQDEIVDQIEERKPVDLFGFEWPLLVEALDYEHAKPYLKEGVSEEEWERRTEDQIRTEAINYLEFAWDKAKNCRGISAGRSLAHYQAWLWLLGDDELWQGLTDYEFYGKDELRKVSRWLGQDPDQWDDGIRVNSEEELSSKFKERG